MSLRNSWRATGLEFSYSTPAPPPFAWVIYPAEADADSNTGGSRGMVPVADVDAHYERARAVGEVVCRGKLKTGLQDSQDFQEFGGMKRTLKEHPILEVPSSKRREEFLAATARSVKLYRHWARPPRTASEFENNLKRLQTAAHLPYSAAGSNPHYVKTAVQPE